MIFARDFMHPWHTSSAVKVLAWNWLFWVIRSIGFWLVQFVTMVRRCGVSSHPRWRISLLQMSQVMIIVFIPHYNTCNERRNGYFQFFFFFWLAHGVTRIAQSWVNVKIPLADYRGIPYNGAPRPHRGIPYSPLGGGGAWLYFANSKCAQQSVASTSPS